MQAARPRSSSSEMAHKTSVSASSNSKASTVTVRTTKGTSDSSDLKPCKVLERKPSSKGNSLPEKRIVSVSEIQQQLGQLQEELKKAREEKSRALKGLAEAKNSMKKEEKDISEHSNKRLRMLELELGKAKSSEGNMLDSLVSQTKQLEQTKILLEEAKLEMMSLQEGAEDSVGRRRSNFGNHVVDKNELKLAMEAEAKSKKAMDDLAIALKEVTTESHRIKGSLSTTQSELEEARAEVESLKALLKTADDKFREANENWERAKLEMDESMASWTIKESGFINCMKASEEKMSKVTEEKERLIHSQRVSREDTSRLRDIMKQALNEAAMAKEALEIARAENSQLKDLASEKENALQRIEQEYECLIVSEAAAVDSVRELKNLLAATSMDSESVVKFPSDNWRIENPRARNGRRHSMGESGMFKVSIYDQEQKDGKTASGSNLADSILPSEDGESVRFDDFDHIDMNQFDGVEPEREFPMKQKKKMPMLRRFGDMLRRSSFHK